MLSERRGPATSGRTEGSGAAARRRLRALVPFVLLLRGTMYLVVSGSPTGCPRDETPWSVDVFPTHCTGPSGARPMSRLRRPLLPVTS